MSEIKKWRKNSMLTQQAMAIQMDIPKRTIEEWEAERRTPPAYVERLIVKELKEITEKTIEKKMAAEMNKMPSDENGNRPVGSWAIIQTHLCDEFVELYDTMQEAIDEFKGEGDIAYIACNQTETRLEAWYMDKKGNIYPDRWEIQI